MRSWLCWCVDVQECLGAVRFSECLKLLIWQTFYDYTLHLCPGLHAAAKIAPLRANLDIADYTWFL